MGSRKSARELKRHINEGTWDPIKLIKKIARDKIHVPSGSVFIDKRKKKPKHKQKERDKWLEN